MKLVFLLLELAIYGAMLAYGAWVATRILNGDDVFGLGV